MDDIRNTRPWFWILVAVLAVVAIVALVIAISASNETVDQKKLVSEATEQVKEEVSGLDEAVEAANEFQEERDLLAAQDRKRIQREVSEAVEGGEGEFKKLKGRVGSLETSVADNTAEVEKLQKNMSDLSAGQKDLEAEVVKLEKRVDQLEKQVE